MRREEPVLAHSQAGGGHRPPWSLWHLEAQAPKDLREPPGQCPLRCLCPPLPQAA